MKIGYLLIILIIFSSCDEHFDENELYGFYVPINFKNTFDTIQIQSKWSYHRKVYNRNNKLVLEMNGKWSLESNTIIHFDSFFLNYDRDVNKFPELLQDTSGGWGSNLYTINGVIQFCLGQEEGKNCYEKITPR